MDVLSRQGTFFKGIADAWVDANMLSKQNRINWMSGQAMEPCGAVDCSSRGQMREGCEGRGRAKRGYGFPSPCVCGEMDCPVQTKVQCARVVSGAGCRKGLGRIER